MITDRDISILKFTNYFGKTFLQVLEKTFFSNKQVAKNRLSKLSRKGLIQYNSTGILSPRSFLSLTSEARKYLEDSHGIEKFKRPIFSYRQVEHNIYEQIIFYWLHKIGKVKRCFKKDRIRLGLEPDLLFYPKDMPGEIIIESELHIKSKERYRQRFQLLDRHNPLAVVYIFSCKKKAKTFENQWIKSYSKLVVLDIDTFISNIKNNEKIADMNFNKSQQLIIEME